MRKILTLLLAIFSGFSTLAAQNEMALNDTAFINSTEEMSLFKLGGYGYINLNEHRGDFEELPGYKSCCPDYEYANAIGFALGGLFELPIMNALSIGAKLGYNKLGGEFIVEENIGNTSQGIFELQNPEAEIKDVYVEHHLPSYLNAISFEPYGLYNIYKGLSASLGLNLSYLFTSDFDQYEEIVRPDNIVFTSGAIRRNETYGHEIPEANKIQAFIVGGLGYEIPINRSLSVAPELRLSLPLTDVTSAADWSVNFWQLGLSLKTPFYKAKEKQVLAETIYVRDTADIYQKMAREESISLIKTDETKSSRETGEAIINTTTITEHYERILPQNVVFDSKLDAYGITVDGAIVENPQIKVEEFESEELFPLLPHVFFPKNSSDLKQTSMKLLNESQVKNFASSKLPWQTLAIYNDMLNVIGERLLRYPKSSITITGTNNNVDTEKGNLNLSKSRAESVKEYFVNVWKIQASRIEVKAKNLPDNPSMPNTADGDEENQRAEISSNTFEIIAPVDLKTIERQINPPTVVVKPQISSDEPIKNWVVNINQGSVNLRKFTGTDQPQEIRWKLDEEPEPLLDLPIEISLDAINELGMRTQSAKTLSIDQVTVKNKRYVMKEDKKYDKLSLILFDFDKAQITPLHQRLLKDIKNRIEPESEITITGYTDRTGDPVYNKELARRRVEEAMKALKAPFDKVKQEAVGQDILLYDNNTPQGRSYSRTVQIIIETPIKNK